MSATIRHPEERAKRSRRMTGRGLLRAKKPLMRALTNVQPQRVVVGFCAEAAGGGADGKAGLIQHAWTRPLRLSAALGSIELACKTRHRKVTWIWPLGQPNRS